MKTSTETVIEKLKASIEELENALRNDGWFSVSDTYKEIPFGQLLVYDGNKYIGYLQEVVISANMSPKVTFNIVGKTELETKITHWMPMPKNPRN